MHCLKNNKKSSAIVLAKSLTGLATLRALSRLDIDLHIVFFEIGSAVIYSRFGRKVFFPQPEYPPHLFPASASGFPV